MRPWESVRRPPRRRGHRLPRSHGPWQASRAAKGWPFVNIDRGFCDPEPSHWPIATGRPPGSHSVRAKAVLDAGVRRRCRRASCRHDLCGRQPLFLPLTVGRPLALKVLGSMVHETLGIRRPAGGAAGTGPHAHGRRRSHRMRDQPCTCAAAEVHSARAARLSPGHLVIEVGWPLAMPSLWKSWERACGRVGPAVTMRPAATVRADVDARTVGLSSGWIGY
jgi:hypothetical protein